MGILTWRNIARAVEVWKDEGLASLIYKLKKLSKQKSIYEEWIQQNEADILKTDKLEWYPKISVVVPVYNVDDSMLVECIESVRKQTAQ